MRGNPAVSGTRQTGHSVRRSEPVDSDVQTYDKKAERARALGALPQGNLRLQHSVQEDKSRNLLPLLPELPLETRFQDPPRVL